jgi:hypothetical protein
MAQTQFKSYRHDPKQSKPERMAHALDWAAVHHKGEAVPYNTLLKAIEGYSQMPRLKTKEVEHVRHSMSRVRGILLSKYNRGLVPMPGIGARATVDDEDQTHNVLKPAARRVAAACENLKKRAAPINFNKIPKTKENVALLAWIDKQIKPLIKQIESGFSEKLLPPVDVKKKDDDN